VVTGPADEQEPGKRLHRNGRDWQLTDDIRDDIHAAVTALPPMTDEQIDAIADVIIAARERRRRIRQLRHGTTTEPERD
jgi:hypothetical protein